MSGAPAVLGCGCVEPTMTGDGWHGSIGGLVPVQGEGCVDGHRFYFRARGRRWEMLIADGHDEPIDCYGPSPKPGWYVREAWGTWPDAGYMPLDVAREKIEQTIAALRAGTLERIGEEPAQ